MNRTIANHAKARAQLDSAEADLRRAFNRWNKLRERVRRYEKRLDADFAKRASEIGGEIDWREFARHADSE